MTRPPTQEKTQHGYVQSAEILARLQTDKLDELRHEVEVLKEMIRKVLDKI